MTPQLPSPHLRECRSCLRDLNLGCYGMQRINADMYSDICKECHNYRRKAHYYRKLVRLNRRSPDEPIPVSYVFPLNEQNRTVLTTLLKDSKIASQTDSFVVELRASNVKTGAVVKACLKMTGKSYVLDLGPLSTYAYETSSPQSFVETMTGILRHLRVRLD